MGAMQRRRLSVDITERPIHYEIHTVTQACTNGAQVYSYFKSLGYTGSHGFFWIKGDNDLSLNNRVIYVIIADQTTVCGCRYRGSVFSGLTDGTAYDAALQIGDQFLVINFEYGAEINIPPNLGSTVGETTASATCVNTAQVYAILPASPNFVIPKIIDNKYRTLAFAWKTLHTCRMNSQTVIQSVNQNASNYDCYLTEGTPLWQISY